MKKPLISVHFLIGSTIPNLFRILKNGRFRLSYLGFLKVLTLLLVLLFFVPLTILDALFYHRKVKKVKLNNEPIFIIGHARSGTTYMHNLITRDEQFIYSSTYQCLMPNSFLSGGKGLEKLLSALIPNKRPMDNVLMGADLPQEDEFGVNAISGYSYFQALCFPKSTKKFFNEYALLNTGQAENWKRIYYFFLQKISFHNPQAQIVSKNPINTVRISVLLEMFPKAKFIYMARDKEEVLNSSFNLYNTLSGMYSFHNISEEELIYNMLWVYDKTIETYNAQKHLIPSENLIEVNYADLISDPHTHVKKIYEELGLSDFHNQQESLNQYIELQKSFQVNTKTFYRPKS